MELAEILVYISDLQMDPLLASCQEKLYIKLCSSAVASDFGDFLRGVIWGVFVAEPSGLCLSFKLLNIYFHKCNIFICNVFMLLTSTLLRLYSLRHAWVIIVSRLEPNGSHVSGGSCKTYLVWALRKGRFTLLWKGSFVRLLHINCVGATHGTWWKGETGRTAGFCPKSGVCMRANRI